MRLLIPATALLIASTWAASAARINTSLQPPPPQVSTNGVTQTTPPATGFTDAPLPDRGASVPVQATGKPGATFGPKLFSPREYNTSQGYLSGSTNAGDEHRRERITPGFGLEVPLQ